MEPGDTVTDHDPGPGQQLRDERERLGITVREVAERLNLSMTTVRAIEADDYARLPGAVYARGYVRAYARLLQVDARPLLASCPYGAVDAGPVPEPAQPSLRRWVQRRPALVLGAGAAVCALAMVVGLAVLWPQGERAADHPRSLPALAGAPEVQMAPGRVEPAAIETGRARAREALEAFEPAVPPDLASAAQPSEPLPRSAQARRISPEGDDLIELRFSDDCWVEVRDGAGVNRYSGLSPAGSELALVGQGPMRVLLGYAPGAELAFNGEVVPLRPHTRNDVATLVLGQ